MISNVCISKMPCMVHINYKSSLSMEEKICTNFLNIEQPYLMKESLPRRSSKEYHY